NPRSTVGTSTEIYDYVKLLFSRVGRTISPISGREVTKDTVTSVVNFIVSLPEDTVVTLFSPLHPHNERTLKEELSVLLQKGFVRVKWKGSLEKIEDLLENKKTPNKAPAVGDLSIVIDRIRVDGEEETMSRMADSVQTAFFEGKGECLVEANGETHSFSDLFELDGMSFEEPSPNFFSFNNPYGACPRCEGY